MVAPFPSDGGHPQRARSSASVLTSTTFTDLSGMWS